MRYRVLTIAASIAVAFIASCIPSWADDAFYEIPLDELRVVEGELPKWGDQTPYQDPGQRVAYRTEIVLDGPGEGYARIVRGIDTFNPWEHAPRVALKAPRGEQITGLLRVASAGRPEEGTAHRIDMRLIKFEVPPTAATEAAEKAFYREKFQYYERLLEQELPGAAWFRHQRDLARQKYSELAGERQVNRAQPAPPIVDRGNAYDLFSGGRAVSENLQLDRDLPPAARAAHTKPTIDIDSLRGITVRSIDWKPLLRDAKPGLDPLAKLIPADQHVVFFPTFAAAVKLADEANGRDTVILNLARPQSEDAGIFAKYERQLGIGLGALGRTIGPALIKSVAVTGSDPYFPTGTDVAVLFETDQPEALAAGLQTQVGLSASQQGGVMPQSGAVNGVKYDGMASPQREMSSYVARLQGAVVVTNSLAQLARLAKVGQGAESIAVLDEYKFFRTRYSLGDRSETAFLFLSDPTIRRWCSPQWRIASARRTFAAAEMAELTGRNLVELASQNFDSRKVDSGWPLASAGETTLTNAGIVSSTLGSLEFMTPIVEMQIEKVTQAEAEAYNPWRDGYQRNWSWAFDPIGLRIGVEKDALSGDLTVMPLIANTEYGSMIAISRGASIVSASGDPHDALAHLCLAINKDSAILKGWGAMASRLAPEIRFDPLGWLGSSVSIYIDDDPIWKELSETPQEERQEFFWKNGWRMPIAFFAEISDPLKLTAFLAALRAFIEQTAPGMTVWDTLTYRDQSYVRISSTPQGRRAIGDDLDVAIYYTPSADGLTITPNEAVLKRALDRRLARMARDEEDKAQPVDASAAVAKKAHVQDDRQSRPWIGSNVGVQVDRRLFDLLSGGRMQLLFGFNLAPDDTMRLGSWNNLPILNQWKRLFPDQNPVELHARLWKTRPVCPGGGDYEWNDEWKTMQSTVYGHPGQPKEGPTTPVVLSQFKNANFGVTFEDQGLRARMELQRDTTK